MGQICSYILDNPDDSQASLAIRSGFTPANVAQYVLDSTVCYSPSTPPDPSPQPNSDGTCYAYIVEPGDDCAFIASNHHITADDIELYNPDTWGWLGCPILQPGAAICLSPGDPPTQAAAPGPVCGPQVSGTDRPSDWSSVAFLNPCPLNSCVYPPSHVCSSFLWRSRHIPVPIN